ncbi:hypothetical protein PF005_g8101 [Phytophthora fragariae]|uniref:Uncharacterized protein n=1 Tax=Phytophthora fragariae TaxID=53985 RepID=A0A6A3SYW4_9STRA|nr:hypothetical protein PF003_g6469 [Phytophthora fragariae]KAE8942090.1 hypothetical protein PF009_g8125 [Phytophthora fragariae]KAE9126430.1 hypothetical protein PF007_g5985 [Phytophthora fragariae]KAE9149037.1 hypothetical protein PF006_g6429 [Phytophthora fragariae]KAE9218825.1 hypothetical protein PF005_g8101 [Phytophthora fragariae]
MQCVWGRGVTGGQRGHGGRAWKAAALSRAFIILLAGGAAVHRCVCLNRQLMETLYGGGSCDARCILHRMGDLPSVVRFAPVRRNRKDH